MNDIKSEVRSKTASTLFDEAPIVLSGTTAYPTSYVQFWGDRSVASIVSKECLASISATDRGVRLLMHEEMPESWLPDVLDAYKGLRDGELAEATHTVTWAFSVPTFTAVAP